MPFAPPLAMADSGSWITVAGLWLVFIAALVAAVALWRDGPRRRAQRLRERFGPEYDIAVEQYGESRAACELEGREHRVSNLPLRSLPPAERASLAQSWLLAQQRFADAPGKAAGEAYELLLHTLHARGYSVEDFDQCVADLSVDYGGIVQYARAVHALDQANRAGLANSEALLLSRAHYQALFEGLLGTPRDKIPPASQRYQPGAEHRVSAPR